MDIKQKAMTPRGKTMRIGLIMAFVGGFVDVYTYITRDGVFAFAQTGNIIFMGMELVEGDISRCLMYLLPVVAYFFGVFITDYLNTKIVRTTVITIQTIILTAEIVMLTVVGFLPTNIPNECVTILISFLSAIQVQSFRVVYNTPYACTMCTGNLRSAAERLHKYFATKDKENLTHFLRYMYINLSFLVGAVVGSFFSHRIFEKATWVSCIFLITALVMIIVDRKKKMRLAHFEK